MIFLKKKNTPAPSQPFAIQTEFPPTLRTFELFKFCSVLFRFVQYLPEGRTLYWKFTTQNIHDSESSIQKEEVDYSPTLPDWEDLRSCIKTSLGIMEMSHGQIMLILEFAKTPDEMKLSDQIEVLNPLQIAYAIEQVLLDFLDWIAPEVGDVSISLVDLKKSLMGNIQRGKILDFKEVLLVASLRECDEHPQ